MNRKVAGIAYKNGLYLPGYQPIKAPIKHHLKQIVRRYFKGTDGKPFDLEDFQVELLELMFKGGKYVVNWPTDHAKSTVTTFLFPILSLMENPNETHIICGASLSDSKSRVQAIENELESNSELLQDYPELGRPEKKEGRRWSSTMFDVKGRTITNRNPSVYAGSIGGKDIKGRRGKLLMDDIEGIEAQTSPTERAKLLAWVRQEAWRCYEDKHETSRPLLIAVGTPFDPDSIYFALELQGWETRRLSAYKSETWTEHDHWRVEYTWPRKAEKIKEARHEMPKEQFAIQYRMDPTGGDPSRLSSQQIAKMMSEGADVTAEVHQTFVSLDPASGSTAKKADYAGIAVVKVTLKPGEWPPKAQIMEAHKFTLGAKEQIDKCAQLADAYECPVIVETNAMQRIYSELFQHFHPETQVIRHNTSANKKMNPKYGLTILTTMLKHGLFSVAEAERDSDGVAALVAELKDLGQPQVHDHISCAVWFAVFRMYGNSRQAAPAINGWREQRDPNRRSNYLDHDPQPVPAGEPQSFVNGWGSMQPYRRFR